MNKLCDLLNVIAVESITCYRCNQMLLDGDYDDKDHVNDLMKDVKDYNSMCKDANGGTAVSCPSDVTSCEEYAGYLKVTRSNR